MTGIDLAGMVIYIFVLALCTAAALAARGARHPLAQAAAWLCCASAFALLTLVRLFEIDDRIELALKLLARETAAYDDRAMLQVPLVGLTIIGAIVLTLSAARVLRSPQADRRDRLVALALFAALGFAPLYAIRVISWHDLDAILYSGGIHLNWLLELALSSLVAICAALYVRASRADKLAAAPRRKREGRVKRGPARRDRR